MHGNQRIFVSVSLSCSVAEYISLAHASQQAVFLKELYNDFTQGIRSINTIPKPLLIQGPPHLEDINKEAAIKTYQDNQASILIAKNEGTSKRLKHVDIKYHYCKELVQQGHISLHYIPTEDQVADFLTKGLTEYKHQMLQ